MMQKVHFRLTSVAQKRCCLSSLIPRSPRLAHKAPVMGATPDAKNVLGFGVFQRRQSNSEESALSRLHILADLLGNKRSWFVIGDWCVSRFVLLKLQSSVAAF